MSGIVQVGVGCIIKHQFQDGLKFLIAQRKNSHGEGTWQLAGGHLEFQESLEECARRESMEETNLDIGEPKLLTTTNDIMETDNKHYVTVFMQSEIKDPTALKVMEPHKIQGDWQWVSWSELTKRTPLFLPLAHLVQVVQQDPELRRKLGVQ
ncbi:NUDIX hydrolase domain-like protein [Halteromyces radiatus]|uniref:NUDIX hydrolase domain-like protein n=1 Tax=Halteromyces radiatus TaxID=101107 RepID=UPI00221F3823|nr:NUDIX hydrolase domain-like protein [Halteromyces radiatus]KAI8097283.1 NUDIX hydrolase domain-like protein [Halteromyces radiatus]